MIILWLWYKRKGGRLVTHKMAIICNFALFMQVTPMNTATADMFKPAFLTELKLNLY